MKCLQFLLANYNSAEHIEILIKSLRTFHPGFSYEILCCDNGSSDGSDEYLEQLPEVRLWRLNERPVDDTYNQRQTQVITDCNLKGYLTPYFRRKTVERDYRTTHSSAINFLIQQVTAPLFVTLDSDIEFLGPYWIEPFLLPLLLDPNVAAVGLLEESIAFNIGKLQCYTLPRLHACLSFWRTAYVWDSDTTWDITNEFDLRFPIMQRSLEEDIPGQLVLGDTGYRAYHDLQEKGHKIVTLAEEDFFRSCRHFFGTTVQKIEFNTDWDRWLASLRLDKKLAPLLAIAELTEGYTKICKDALDNCQRYWAEKHPVIPKQLEVPLVFLG